MSDELIALIVAPIFVGIAIELFAWVVRQARRRLNKSLLTHTFVVAASVKKSPSMSVGGDFVLLISN